MNRRRAQAGFSVLEAIISLLIASMILSVIMPIASRSISDNLRIGMRGLDAFALSIEEAAFRGLASAAMPAPTRPFSPPARDMLAGTSSQISMTAMAPFTTLCVPQGVITGVTLRIEQQGSSGRLICSAEDREREMMRWTDAQASFAYSSDGRGWSDRWPAEDRGADEVVLGLAQIPTIDAPRVRFTLMRDGRPAVTWVAAFGSDRPVEYLLEDMGSTPP